jgi:hypothetical protein
MHRRTLILVILAVVVGLAVALAQYVQPSRAVVMPSPQPRATQTSGVIRELREPTFLSSSRLQRATVLLVDGTSVDASVSPGCVIHAGQPVTIYVLSWRGVSKRAYVVAAAK